VLVALTPAADAQPLGELVWPDRRALLLGTEGPGLSADWLAAADIRVRIPMARGVDSLNVAAAAAIAFYVSATSATGVEFRA
jgi:tRNA G18 (ribose-2'-O)-methylase SpoU